VNLLQDKPYIEDIEGLGRDCDAAAVTSWRNYLKRHDSLLVDHCHGMQKSHLTCPQCGKESIKFDVYSSLSLTLDSTRHQNTLLDCLDKFTQGEELDEANGWYCSQCQKHVCARKKIQLWTTPDILILHLKRFTFKANGSKKHGLVRSKIQDVINFPIDRLDLHKYVYGPKDELAPPIYKVSETCQSRV
jgi:ubiquitin carboxyl-terminal hydrolase 8